MKQFTAELESLSTYSQGKWYSVEKLPKELAKDYEARTWRNRMHVDKDGYVFIPPMAFKNCVRDVAKHLSIGVPGKGKATYTKHFKSGILVTEGITLPVKAEDVEGVWRPVPSDGVTGSGKRVLKCFPEIPKWSGSVTFYILDDLITRDVFLEHLEQAGQLIGIGVFRPQNGGFYGRFAVKKLTGG